MALAGQDPPEVESGRVGPGPVAEVPLPHEGGLVAGPL